MSERGIPMCGSSVTAILAGRKSQTRRAMKVQPLAVQLDSTCKIDDEFPTRWFTFDHDTNGRLEYARPCVRQKATKRQRQKAADRNPDARWCANEIIGLCPYGIPGDLLYVKETWAVDSAKVVHYKVDEPHPPKETLSSGREVRTLWRSSRFMAKHFARLWLKILDVRVQRVQEINDKDIRAEGILGDTYPELGEPCASEPQSARIYYIELWDSLNAKRGYGWAANPWVWAISFEQQPAGDRA
jgi:hypothetical protein